MQKLPKIYEEKKLTKITISTKKLLKVAKIAINWYKLPNAVWSSQNLQKKCNLKVVMSSQKLRKAVIISQKCQKQPKVAISSQKLA